MTPLLIILQTIVVLLLALHDWIPLPPLNDIAAVQAADSRSRLVWVTVLTALPFAIGLAASLGYVGTHAPTWLRWWLWISYSVLLLGALRAWWKPYLLVPDAARAARYRRMFSRTHAFLPMRNGIQPNTLHVLLHAALVATLAALATSLH